MQSLPDEIEVHPPRSEHRAYPQSPDIDADEEDFALGVAQSEDQRAENLEEEHMNQPLVEKVDPRIRMAKAISRTLFQIADQVVDAKFEDLFFLIRSLPFSEAQMTDAFVELARELLSDQIS